MKEPKFQKFYFIETFTLNYNEIAICLVNKYNVEQIKFTPSQSCKCKYDILKKQIFNRPNAERIKEIKLFVKNLLISNIKYKDFIIEKEKSIRIFGTNYSMSLLTCKDIN